MDEDEIVDEEPIDEELSAEDDGENEAQTDVDESENEAPQEVEAEAAEVERPAPAPVYIDPGETPAEKALREHLEPETYRLMMAAQEAREARLMASFGASQVHITAAAAEMPQLFREYGPVIQQAIANMPPAERSKPTAINAGIAMAFYHEAEQVGATKALAKFAGMVTGTPAPREKAPKAPIPAAQRPPSPGAGSAPAIRPLNTEERRVEMLTKRYGLTKAEAKAALVDEGVA